MDKIGRNKKLWLLKQGCVFKKDEREPFADSTQIYTAYGEYVGMADLGKNEQTVNFIYKHRLTNLMSVRRASNLPLRTTGCNTVCIGFNVEEQTWYGWTHRGFGKFYIGYIIVPDSIMDRGKFKTPFKVETLDQAKELAILIADYLN